MLHLESVVIRCVLRTEGEGRWTAWMTPTNASFAELAEHARATFAEIGHEVVCPPGGEAPRRLDARERRHQGFTTVVDRNALGYTTEAYVQIFCHGRIAPDQLRRLRISSARHVTGTSDGAILHVPLATCGIWRPPERIRVQR